MASAFMGLNPKTAKFYVEYIKKDFDSFGNVEVKEITEEFAGTLEGAYQMVSFLEKLESKGYSIDMSSDFFHPEEFPMFEENAINVASGE